MFLIFVRTFKESLKNLWRNGLLSIVATSMIAVSLCLISIVFLLTSSANSLIKNYQARINVTAYFKSDVPEETILKIKKDLENFSEIKEVEYVTKEKALEEFRSKNADNPVIIKSLEEIGGNPLLSSLVIRAKSSDKYESISNYISNSTFKNDVSRLNYMKNKSIIEQLNSSENETKRSGLAIAIVFGVMATLITFNTIRMTIYTRKQEIEVMRLVGASNTYIRLPFIFEGISYGIIACIFSTGLLFVTVKFLIPMISFKTVPYPIILSTYYSSFLIILGIQLVIGVVIGVLSSLIAIRKYLKI